MFVPYTLIGIAILGVGYILIRVIGRPRFKENPDRIMGVKIEFLDADALGLAKNEHLRGTIEAFDDGQYKVELEWPFGYEATQSKEARIWSRHAGYPVSRLGRSRTGTIAVNGKLNTGQAFVAVLRRR